MKIIRILICIFSLSLFTNPLPARELWDSSPIDFSAEFKTKHLWRGLEVSNSALIDVDIHLRSRDKSFAAGLWSGASFDGKFREFDYYLSFSKNGFTIALWDIYNFSPDATYNNSEVFNYKAHETGHFIDLSLSYRFQHDVPLRLGWATILHGRDRGATNEKNIYSTYVFADYPVVRNKVVDVEIGLAGAFSLNPYKGCHANFYSQHNGIVDIHLLLSKDIKIGNYVLPVSVLTLWNPANNNANIQLAVGLF